MIVLGEKQDGVNVLHVILGPESLFQFNLNGQSVMDITEYINNFRSEGERCVIVVNRCDSEEELLHMLQFHQAKMRAMNMMNQIASQVKGEESQHKETPQKKDTKKGNDKGIDCPECGGKSEAVVVNGTVYPCKVCQKINTGLKKGIVPPLPSLDDLDKLRKKTESEVPAQKKSIFRFYEKDKNKNEPPTDEKKKK